MVSRLAQASRVRRDRQCRDQRACHGRGLCAERRGGRQVDRFHHDHRSLSAMPYELMIECLGLAVVAAPSLLLIVLGVTSLVGHPLSERMIGRLVQIATLIGLVASIVMLG